MVKIKACSCVGMDKSQALTGGHTMPGALFKSLNTLKTVHYLSITSPLLTSFCWFVTNIAIKHIDVCGHNVTKHGKA